MKQFNILLFLVLSLPFIGNGQTSGVIQYTSISKNDRPLPPNMPEDIKKMIPKERKVNKELYFNQSAAIYKNGKQEAVDEAEFGGNERAQRIRRRFSANRANEKTYTDLATKTSLKTRDLLGKTFLIEDEPKKYQWKMTGQKKQILEYLAMEATTMMNDTVEVTAWFTPQIPVSTGPAELGGLPGAILEASIGNRTSTTITATNVELRTIEEDEIEQPKKGEKVTQEEFIKISREKMKERRGSRGGRGQGRGRRG